MKGSDETSKKGFQTYVQMPYKPFQFQEPSENLNLRLIANIDPDQLYSRGDLDQASSVLKNFVNSHLPKQMDYEMFQKLFRLSQLAVEYYSQEQIQKQQALDEQYTSYKTLQDQEKQLSELKIQHSEKKDKYGEQIKNLNAKVKEMKANASKSGSFKCVYCQKCYREREQLDYHVKRRHIDMLHEVQETKDMLKDRQDPIHHLKKTQQEELREQNKIQLERMQELQKQLDQAKINESKLVQEISQKLQEDFDKKIYQIVSKNNAEAKIEQERSAKKQKEIAEKESQNIQKDVIVNDSILKMSQNLETFQKTFQKIQESQVKLNQQQAEYTKQLDKIQENQEDLKKSSLLQSSLLKESQLQNNSSYFGNIVSQKQAPQAIHSRSNSKSDIFPVQPTPTADFKNADQSKEIVIKKQQYSEQKPEENDSFLNNNSIVEDQPKLKDFEVIQIKSGFQPRLFHVGDLEDDYDSQDENRKQFQEFKQQQAIKHTLMRDMRLGDTSNKQKNNHSVNQWSQPQLDYQYSDSHLHSGDQAGQPSYKQLKQPKSQVKVSMSDINTDLSMLDEKNNSNNQNNYKKKQEDLLKKIETFDKNEDEDDDEEVEEDDFFKKSKSIEKDEPTQPNVLANQMSFGGNKIEQQNKDLRKSNFMNKNKNDLIPNIIIKEESRDSQAQESKSQNEKPKQKNDQQDIDQKIDSHNKLSKQNESDREDKDKKSKFKDEQKDKDEKKEKDDKKDKDMKKDKDQKKDKVEQQEKSKNKDEDKENDKGKDQKQDKKQEINDKQENNKDKDEKKDKKKLNKSFSSSSSEASNYSQLNVSQGAVKNRGLEKGNIKKKDSLEHKDKFHQYSSKKTFGTDDEFSTPKAKKQDKSEKKLENEWKLNDEKHQQFDIYKNDEKEDNKQKKQASTEEIKKQLAQEQTLKYDQKDQNTVQSLDTEF